jgi:hypothetical protein
MYLDCDATSNCAMPYCDLQEDGSLSYGKTKGGKAKKNGKCKKSSKTKKVGYMRGASNQLVGRILNAMDKHREVFTSV